MACWLIPAGIGLVVTLTLGWAEVSFAALDGRTLLLALYLPLLVFLFEALPEELVFRGYFYRNLADRYSRWIAVIGQAAPPLDRGLACLPACASSARPAIKS